MSEYKLKLSFLDPFWQPLVLPPVEVIFGQKVSPRHYTAHMTLNTLVAVSRASSHSLARSRRPKLAVLLHNETCKMTRLPVRACD